MNFENTYLTLHAKKCVFGTEKHIAVQAILLTILTINVATIT